MEALVIKDKSGGVPLRHCDYCNEAYTAFNLFKATEINNAGIYHVDGLCAIQILLGRDQRPFAKTGIICQGAL
jgi:hypothetical protein